MSAMEIQQELKLLGFFGILRKSFNLIFSHKKIFSQITALLIPITLIFQAQILTSVLLSQKMFKNVAEPEDFTVFIVPKYSFFNFSYIDSFKWVAIWILTEIAYVIMLMILFLPSTVTFVYTIACIYIGKDVNFMKAIAVIPKVWKRVLITILLCFAMLCFYDYILGAIAALISRILFFKRFATIKIVIGVVLLILYIAGFVYITMIWHLATVVSVMEDNNYWMKAIIKSRNLIKGKRGVTVGMFIFLMVFSAGVDTAFELLVVYGAFNIGFRIGIGILCFFLKLLVTLLGFVVQTVIYFVCKSYHNEYIEVYVADQKANDVEMNSMYTLLSSET